MGILDDAIREHLELKRQHGAPEEEVQRQQDEALGPARREVAPPAEDGDQAADPEAAEPVEAADLTEAEEPLEADEPEPLDLDEPEPLEVDEPELLDADHPAAAEPLAPTGDTPPRGFEPEQEQEEPDLEPLPHEAADDPFGGDEPFADEDAKGHPDDDEEPDEEGDVLEDTPDFLQETPEHDRLWFEQKPPRDFDFD